ncbi:MAG TPA: hypothetical protein VF171_09830 [Trueperaceae bacterium]
MSEKLRPTFAFVLGFAVGLGLCVSVLFGIPAVFWLEAVNDWLMYGVAFVVGGVAGLLLGPRVGARPGVEA